MLEQMTDFAGEPSDTRMDTDQGVKKIMEIFSTTTAVQQFLFWDVMPQ